MVAEGVDYSYDPPTPSGLITAGKTFVVRYGAVGNPGKHLTAAEAKALTGAGLGIVANVEETAQALRGTAAGVRHATAGDSFFRGLGMPADRPIYFSVDWDAGDGDWPDIDAALRGAASVLGPDRVGVYGSYATVAHCAAATTAQWFWQTYAWSAGKWHPACHLQQYSNNVSLGGGTVDLTRAVRTDFGQWGGLSVATSQNGWTVDQTGEMQDRTSVDGVTFPNGIRKGDVATVLKYVAHQFHLTVEPLQPGACWGWFVKTISGSTQTSNHSSGTAIDLNAPDHPLGVPNTFSSAQVAAIRKILDYCDGVVRWGGDYSSRKDDMHFEINKGSSAVAALAAKIRTGDDMPLTSDDKTWLKSPEFTAAVASAVASATWAFPLEDPLSTTTPKGKKQASTYQRYLDPAVNRAVTAAQQESAKLAEQIAQTATAAATASVLSEVTAVRDLIAGAGGNAELAPVIARLDALEAAVTGAAQQAGSAAAAAVLSRLSAAQRAGADLLLGDS